MKGAVKIYVLVLVSLFFQVLNAQEEINSEPFVLGGAINFSMQNNSTSSSTFTTIPGLPAFVSGSVENRQSTNFAFTPYFGKEINRHLLVGVELKFTTRKYRSTVMINILDGYDIERVISQTGGGFFVRYLLNPENKLNVYLQPYAKYGVYVEDRVNIANGGFTVIETNTNYIDLGINGGALYNISDKIRAVLKVGGLNYINGKRKIQTAQTSEQKFSLLGTNLNIASVFFGVEFKF